MRYSQNVPLPRIMYRRVGKEARKQKTKEARKGLLTSTERRFRQTECFTTYELCDTVSQSQKGDD